MADRLKKLRRDIVIIERYKNYLKKELAKTTIKESKVRKKIIKEKRVIQFLNKIKRMR